MDKLALRQGMGKIELTSRAIQWLAVQDKTLQAIVLGQIDAEDEANILDLIKTRKASAPHHQMHDCVESVKELLLTQNGQNSKIKLLSDEDIENLNNLRQSLSPDPTPAEKKIKKSS